MKRVAAIWTAAFATAACGDLLPPDLMAEAVSPDGQLVARSWCRDACDVTAMRTITVSPADMPVKRDSMPPNDQVFARVNFETRQAPYEIELRWSGDRTLTITGACLTDTKYRPLRPGRLNGVDLHFVRKPSFGRCWQEAPRKDAPE